MAAPSKDDSAATPEVSAQKVVAQAAAEPIKEAAAEPSPAVTEEAKGSIAADEDPKAEEPTETSDQEHDAAEATPVEPSIPEWKEESNIVADLKENEKKALEELKVRIEQAVKDGEFKAPKKVVKADVPEPEAVATEEVTKEVSVTPEETVESSSVASAGEEEKEAEATTPAAEEKEVDTPAPLASEKVEAKTVPVPEPAKDTKAEATPAVAKDPKATATSAPAEAKDSKVEATPAEAKDSKAEVTPVAATDSKTDTTPTPANDAKIGEIPVAPEKAETKVDEKIATTLDEKATISADLNAANEGQEVAAEDEEADEDPEEISLWGVPLLQSKGDKRTDVVLLKFLRARKFNVKEAFKQLKNTIVWRKTFKADDLLNEEFDKDLDKAAFLHGFTKDGLPVCYDVRGVFQDKDLYQKTFGDEEKLNTFLRWRVQVLEKGIKLLSFTPEGASSVVQIDDLKNAPGPSKTLFKTAINQAITLLQDNYPELSSQRIFVNVPKYFSAMYSVVSPVLSKRTKSKFVVAPAGKTTEYLLKAISADNIPVQYGGLSRPNDEVFTPGSAEVHELPLKGPKSTPIEIDATEVGSTIVWDLSVIGFDVSYGAEFVPSAEGSYTIVIEKPKKLPATTEEPVRNSFKVTTPGKLVLTVENSSKKKKTVLYRYLVKSTAAATV